MSEINEQLDPALEGLEPRELWKNFNVLRQLARPSKKEQPVMEWLSKWASEHNFETTRDAVENLCIKVPATEGFGEKFTVCLQGHADMVCEARKGVKHDFENDPIQLERKGDLLKAQDTTLGADNGIGLTAAMTIATDPDVKHPALEILITRDEEQDFTGAFGFDPKALGMKSTLMINLDNEDIGDICLSSAGIIKLDSAKTIARTDAAEMNKGGFYEISISDMPGGHSGTDINRNRGNAIIVMARLLSNLPSSIQLVSIEGGSAKNAIPTGATAIIFTEEKNLEKVKAVITEFEGTLPQKTEPKKTKIEINPKNAGEVKLTAMTAETRRDILNILVTLKNGVIKMDPEVDGLPETSVNIGTIQTTDNEINLGFAVRGKSNDATLKVAFEIEENLKKQGFKTTTGELSPAWTGDPNTKLVGMVSEAYKKVTGKEVCIKGVHGGLETGVLVNKLKEALEKNVDAVAIGPTIKNNHSPDEFVDTPSVKTFYEQLKRIFKEMEMENN